MTVHMQGNRIVDSAWPFAMCFSTWNVSAAEKPSILLILPEVLVFPFELAGVEITELDDRWENNNYQL